MLPELRWEIALYLDLPEIELFFPELLASETFWDELFERDFPDMTGDEDFYRKLLRLSEVSNKFGNKVVQMDVLEELIERDMIEITLERLKSSGYLTEKEIPIELDMAEWKSLKNEKYLEPTYYFRNGKGFVLPFNIYMIEDILNTIRREVDSISWLYVAMGVQWNRETIERIIDGLVQKQQFTLLDTCSDRRMYSTDLIRQISKYESDIGYKRKLEIAKSKFVQAIL